MQIQIKRKNYQRSIKSYLVMTVLLLAGAGYYGYTQFTQLAMAQDAITQGNAKLLELNQTAADTLNNYSSLYSAYENEYAETKKDIDEVFPTKDNYTELTKILESYVNDLGKSPDNPITMDSIQYSPSQLATSGDYSIMPFNITLLTTRSNFEKFVRYIQNSGDLRANDDSAKVRLMEINSFNMNFVPPSEEQKDILKEPLLNVTMSLNAYFQKPDESSTQQTVQ